jgi:hypothetical protein
MTEPTPASHPRVPAETDAAIIEWMGAFGWRVAPGRWHLDPDGGFHIWQETARTTGGVHALWISEPIIKRLPAPQLIEVLNGEDVANEIRISTKIRIQERGAEYRVSVVSRASGEWKKLEG